MTSTGPQRGGLPDGSGGPQQPSPVPLTGAGWHCVPVYVPARPARQSNGLAIAALVLGICAWIPFIGALPGLLAVIFGIIVLAKGRPGRRMAIAGIIVSLSAEVLTVLGAVFFWALGPTNTMAKQAMCGSNLNGIGKAAAIYQAENADAPPPNLSVLVSGKMIGSRGLKCPVCQKAATSGSDYFYAPPAANAPPTALVACDFRRNHADGSRNMLCADGTVRLVQTRAQFKAELSKSENAAFAAALASIEGPP